MTARSVTSARTNTSASLASQTWDMGFPTDVEFTSFVCDINAADTYSLKIDGSTVVSGVVATAGQTGVTFTPGAPVALGAGVHTFQLIGTASRAYYYNTGILDDATGDTAYAAWGLWSESSTHLPHGTINFTEDGSTLTAGMQRSSQSGSSKAAMTWDVTFDSSVAFDRMLWLVDDTDTYKLQIDGTDVATGVSGTTKRMVNFQPASPVAVASGTHTFKIVPTASRTYYYRNTATPLLGSSHVTTWAVWSEGGGTTRVAGLMGFSMAITIAGERFTSAWTALDGDVKMGITIAGEAFASAATALDGSLNVGTTIAGEVFVAAATALDGTAQTSIIVSGDTFVSDATFLDGTIISGVIVISGEAFSSAATLLDGAIITPITIAGEAFAATTVMLDGSPLVTTDLSNAFAGLDLAIFGTVTAATPVAPSPPGVTFGTRVDKAIAYPVPDMVDGRPT